MAQELPDHRWQLPICAEPGDLPVVFDLAQVVAEKSRNRHGDGRTHHDLEIEIADHRRPVDDVEIAMEPDLAWPDEGVVEPTDLGGTGVRPRTHRILDTAVKGEQT